jgi:ribonuclease G
MYVHPYVDAFLKKGLVSLSRRWKLELGGKFKIMPDQSLAYLEYRVIDRDKNVIDLAEEKDLETSSTKSKTKAKERNSED